MNLSRYEIFLKVAEIGNITRTAELLNYTQAGISHAIVTLEKEAGFPLLIRSKTGVTVTEDGKRLIAPMQALVNEQRNLMQTMQEINGAVSGTLRIGTFTSVTTHWMPVMIREFQKNYPDVKMELQDGDFTEITERLLSGKSDCGFFSLAAGQAAGIGLDFTPLYEDPMEVMIPKDHPLAGKESITLEEVKQEPLIMQMKGSNEDFTAVLSRSRKPAYVQYTVNDDYSVMSLVDHGFGITIVPRMISANYKGNPEIRPLDPPAYRVLGLALPPENRASVLAKTFRKFITDPSNEAIQHLFRADYRP